MFWKGKVKEKGRIGLQRKRRPSKNPKELGTVAWSLDTKGKDEGGDPNLQTKINSRWHLIFQREAVVRRTESTERWMGNTLHRMNAMYKIMLNKSAEIGRWWVSKWPSCALDFSQYRYCQIIVFLPKEVKRKNERNSVSSCVVVFVCDAVASSWKKSNHDNPHLSSNSFLFFFFFFCSRNRVEWQ